MKNTLQFSRSFTLCHQVALAVLCLALAASAASNDGPLRRRRTEEEQHDFVRGEFELFKEKFGRSYQTPEEEAQRLKVFRDNLKNIQVRDENVKRQYFLK